MNNIQEAKITREKYEDRQGNSITAVYEDGNLVERTTYNKKGEMVEVYRPGDLRSCYVYNDNGNEIECNQFFKYTPLEGKILQKAYDQKGELVGVELVEK